MEKKKDELLNFAFDEQDDKLKFYRETLVQMTKEAYQKSKLKDGVIIESIVKEADELAKAIIKKIDEFEKSFNYQTQIIENPKVSCTNNMWTGPASGLSFIDLSSNSVKQMADSVKDSMRTIVDNGPQYQPNQKPYGTLGEHWKELMVLFEIKEKQGLDVVKNMYNNGVLTITTDCKTALKLSKLVDTLGGDFIKDFIKACEKCEE